MYKCTNFLANHNIVRCASFIYALLLDVQMY